MTRHAFLKEKKVTLSQPLFYTVSATVQGVSLRAEGPASVLA